MIIVGKLLGLNETCEPGLGQCRPGLICRYSFRLVYRMPMPGMNKFFENSTDITKPARCREETKGSVDQFTSIYVYVSSCKLIEIIIEGEDEPCEKDEECHPEMICVKRVRVDKVSYNIPGLRIVDSRIVTVGPQKKTGKCKRKPGSVANLFFFLFVFNLCN